MSLEDVQTFWNTRPCNINHSNHPFGTKEYFDAVETKKYFVEPHIPGFAEFKKWTGKKVLEIGCGLGTESINFARAGADLTIVELSAKSLEICRQRFAVYGLSANFICGNAEELDTILEDQKFDLVWSFGVIHHTPYPEKIIAGIRKVLKPGGELRIMLYSKISYKLFHIMHETDCWKIKNIPNLIREYSEAKQGCPVTFTYNFNQIRVLLEGFKIEKIWKDHIFTWDIPSYVQHKYVKAKEWEDVDEKTLAEYSEELGWHTMVIAKSI